MDTSNVKIYLYHDYITLMTTQQADTQPSVISLLYPFLTMLFSLLSPIVINIRLSIKHLIVYFKISSVDTFFSLAASICSSNRCENNHSLFCEVSSCYNTNIHHTADVVWRSNHKAESIHMGERELRFVILLSLLKLQSVIFEVKNKPKNILRETCDVLGGLDVMDFKRLIMEGEHQFIWPASEVLSILNRPSASCMLAKPLPSQPVFRQTHKHRYTHTRLFLKT